MPVLASLPILLLSLVPPAPAAQAAAPSREAIAAAMERVYPALVRIHAVVEVPGDGRMQKYETYGSGVIISPDGHVITNHHVAGRARRVSCTLPDGEEVEATLVGSDPLADIAVLKLRLDARPPGSPVPHATFGDSDALRVGDPVLAMGSPAALSQSVTSGIVSNTRLIMPDTFWGSSFEQEGEKVGSLVRWIGHDAQIFGGNSGGPLVTPAGEIVGINEIGIGPIGGAIPSNLAREVARSLIEKGSVERSWTGLDCQPRLAGAEPKRGVLVSGVITGSPAARAGVQPGDVILRFDGVEVDCAHPEGLPLFNRLVLSTPIGKPVELTVWRAGRSHALKLVTEGRGTANGDDRELRGWGATWQDFTRLSALENRRPDTRGVLVVTVRPGGPASDARPPIQPGDVLVEVAGKRVDGFEELSALSAELTAGREEPVSVVATVERGTRKLLTAVRIGKERIRDQPMHARKAWVAVATQVFTRELAETLGMSGTRGVRVTLVYPGSEAERAGLKVGDVLTHLDGDEIAASTPEDGELFSSTVRQRAIGSQALLDVLRAGERRKVALRLEESPPSPSDLKSYRDQDFEFTAREIGFEERVEERLEPETRGLRIDRVEPAGLAALAHLAVGDILLAVNGRPTPGLEELESSLAEARRRKLAQVVFFVRRGIHTLYLELKPSWEKR